MPKQLFTPLEHDEQVAFLDWISWHPDERLKLIFAIPNGGKRSIRTAVDLKAEGVRPGVPDLFLPIAAKSYHGLFIEMKRKGGYLSPEQKIWKASLEDQCYMVAKCCGCEEAISTVNYYLGLQSGTD